MKYFINWVTLQLLISFIPIKVIACICVIAYNRRKACGGACEGKIMIVIYKNNDSSYR